MKQEEPRAPRPLCALACRAQAGEVQDTAPQTPAEGTASHIDECSVTPQKCSGKKSMKKRKRNPKTSTKNRCQCFLDFFRFIALLGVFQRREFKSTTKNVLQKNRVEKFLQKVRPKIQNRFFLEIVFSRFWAFLDKMTSKTR
jgi:hypothetical protein